ncbi:fibronectin type III domain-containing protein [uncultured Ruminococcus sp.]|uniref:fibronectin type III domain-containing protein n=1 Tax=uncultured Ruminococcus sp. TaxID=165186 RepID=UPI0025FA11E6|nr:fibronectin type III domain-containing protein [uncultured Ruminococcus sp.]
MNTKRFDSKRLLAGIMALALAAGVSPAGGSFLQTGTAIVASAAEYDDVAEFNAATEETPVLKLSQDYNRLTIERDDGIVDLNGYSVDILFLRNDDPDKTVTVRNGIITNEIDGAGGYRDDFKGKVVLEDLDVRRNVWVDGHTVTVRSGSYTRIKNYTNLQDSLMSTVYIEGGKITNLELGSKGESYVISGGTFANQPKEEWLDEGTGCTKTDEGWFVCKHTYNKPEWIWNKEDHTADAKFTCVNGDDEQIIEGRITRKVTAPTCTKDGVITYTATAKLAGKTWKDTYKEAGEPATGHKKGEAVKENYVAPTYTADGSYDMVVYCTECGEELSRETFTIDKLKLTMVEAVEPTCRKDGNIRYWHDQENDKYFTDDKGEHEITADDTILPAKGHTSGEAVKENYVAPTYSTEGSYDEVVYCTECGKEISRKTVTVDKLKYTAPKISVEKNTTSAKLTWTEVKDMKEYGIAGYQNGKWTLLDKCTDTSYVISGLSAGKEYKVAVVAMIDDKWIMDFSNAVTVTTKGEGNALYPQVQTAVKDKKIGFKWSAVAGAEKYGIAVYQANKWKVVKQLDGSITSWTSPQVASGRYRLVVLAKVDGQWVSADAFKKSFYVAVK